MIKFVLDISDIVGMENILDNAKKELDTAAEQMAQLTKAHMLDLASQRLKSRRKIFVKHLNIIEEDGVKIIQLDAEARWTDDGMPAHNMLDDLLKNAEEKDGVRNVTVPFEHNKNPSDQTPAQASLSDTIRNEFRDMDQRIPWKKIETDTQGNPRLGLIHSVDIMEKPIKSHSGPGQGQGPVGDVRQGPTGIPLLQGIRVYQNEVEGPGGRTKIQKSVVTFRVASSKHKSEGGRWDHPGVEPANIFDDATEWAKQEFDKMGSDIIARIVKSL